MSDITNRIDKLLTERNLKRADLCRATNIPDSTIRSWVKGSIPNVEALQRVADFFNVPLVWLASGRESENIPVQETKINLVDNEEKLLEVYRQLSDEDRATVERLIKALNNSV